MVLIRPIIIHIIVFVMSVFVFTLLYKYFCNYSFEKSLYISLSTGTFAGATIDEKEKKARQICTFQLFFMYILMVVILNEIIR